MAPKRMWRACVGFLEGTNDFSAECDGSPHGTFALEAQDVDTAQGDALSASGQGKEVQPVASPHVAFLTVGVGDRRHPRTGDTRPPAGVCTCREAFLIGGCGGKYACPVRAVLFFRVLPYEMGAQAAGTDSMSRRCSIGIRATVVPETHDGSGSPIHWWILVKLQHPISLRRRRP